MVHKETFYIRLYRIAYIGGLLSNVQTPLLSNALQSSPLQAINRRHQEAVYYALVRMSSVSIPHAFLTEEGRER